MKTIHTITQTENGTTETWRRIDKDYYSAEEYLEILKEFLSREGIVFDRIDYLDIDPWAYQHRGTTDSLNPLQFDETDSMDAFFSDNENEYILRYKCTADAITLETRKKKG